MADDKARGHSMDRELVSAEPHELEYLARTHGASVAEVQEVIREVGSQSERGLGASGPSERGTSHLARHDSTSDQGSAPKPGTDRHSR